jgi:hypothetical protein
VTVEIDASECPIEVRTLKDQIIVAERASDGLGDGCRVIRVHEDRTRLSQ